MPEHYFNIEFAEKYGILEAIIMNNLLFWITKNKANGDNFHDGKYWTFNSTRAYTELFPYASQGQIERALKHLRDEGIIQTGNYNEQKYIRTLWYAITEKGESILQGCGIHFSNLGNAFSEFEETITYNKPNKKNTDIKNKDSVEEKPQKRFSKPTIEEVQAYCLERKNGINAKRFVDYYESKGWLVGKTPMKDWRAAVRTWESNNKKDINSRPDTGNDDPILNAIFDGTYTG